MGTLHLPSTTSPAEHFHSQHTPGLPVHTLSPSQHVADNKHCFGYTLDMNADTGESILTFKNRFDPTANCIIMGTYVNKLPYTKPIIHPNTISRHLLTSQILDTMDNDSMKKPIDFFDNSTLL